MKRAYWVIVLLAVLAVPVRPNGAAAAEDARAPLPKAFGEPRSVQVAAALGAASESIALEVSPGRRGVEPRLMLTYSSMGGGGFLGAGWSLELGRVERWRGDGTPTVGDPDSYGYALAGAGGELRHAGDGLYRARLETLYREFRRNGDGWRMYDGEGNLHRFGGTPESRIDGEVWLLDLVQDPRGNTISYSYLRDGGALYPTEIRYTGYAPAGDLGANRVTFEYETRADERIVLTSGVREERSLRLLRVSAFASGRLARRYEFSYAQSPLNGQSQLVRITLVGADDRSRVTLRTLAYGTRTLGWTEVSAASFPGDLADGDGKEVGLRLGDVNGDGFADVVGNGADVWLGDGAGGFARDAGWSASLAAAGISFVNGDGADTGARLIDVNADQRPDLLIAAPSRLEVRLNTGTGWVPDAGWSASLAGIGALARCYADPYYMGSPTDCTPPHCGGPLGNFPSCTLPHCKGNKRGPDCSPPECTGHPSDPSDCLPPECTATVNFTTPFVEPFALVDGEGDSKGALLSDVNADGRLDILWSMSRKTSLFWMFGRTPVFVRGAFLNTGAGWALSDPLTEALWQLPGEFVTDSELQGWDATDVNGDGLADLVRTLEGAAREALLGNGAGWSADAGYAVALGSAAITSLSGDRKGRGLMPTDFDDDGLLDYLQSGAGTPAAWRGTGRGWTAAPAMASFLAANGIAFNDGEGKATGAATVDFDGDGIADFVVAKAGARRLWLSAALRDGLLLSVASAIGETTELAWGLSTALDNRRADGVEGLPAPMTIVRSLTRHDGRGSSWTHSFDYRGGLFAERSFRGFARSTHALSAGLSVVRSYRQDEAFAGQFFLEEGFDPEGSVRTRRRVFYETVDATPTVRQPRILRTEEESLDPGGARRTGTEYVYDARLNTVAVRRDPDLDTLGDEVTTVFTWVLDQAAGFWSLPARVQAYLAGGTLASETITLYDGLEEGRVGQGLPTSVQERLAPGLYVERRMAYDGYGNVVEVADREGQKSNFSYGEPTATFRTRAVDPEGRETRSEYDARFGALARDRDAAGAWTVQEYDAFGRLVRLVLPGDEASPAGTRTIAWSALGDPGSQYYRVAETETPGRPGTLDTVYRYDGLGMIWRTEREGAAGRAVLVQSAFDEAGNALSTTRPFFAGDEPAWTVIERDVLRRPVRITEPDGLPLLMSHAGPRVTVVDRRGASSTFVRNGDGQTTEVRRTVGGAEQTTRYRYDAVGQLREIVDAIGERTAISYDGLGRRTALADPNAGTWRYAYDREGRLIAQTAPDGRVTRFVYNRAGDLLRKEFPDGSRVLFEYGRPGEPRAAGRLVRVQDAAGTLTIRYDARGAVAERRRAVARGRTYVTGYAHDSMGRLRQVVYPDGFTTAIAYDGGGNLASVTDGTGRVIAAGRSYTAAGQLAVLGFGNGATSAFDYSDMLRMTSIDTSGADGRVLQDLDYTYDPGGNVTALADGAARTSQEFAYDEAGRLISALGPYGEELYDYDAVGNLLRKGNRVFAMDPLHPQRAVCAADLTYDPGRAGGIAHNPHAAVCSAGLSGSGAASAGPANARDPLPSTRRNPNIARAFSIAYDSRGNVVAREGKRFEYDAENRMVRVREANGRPIEENVYDAWGELVVRRTAGETVVFIDGIYEEGQTHASRHVSAGPLAVASVTTPRAGVQLIDAAPPSPYERGKGRRLRGALGPAGAAGVIALAFSLVLAAPGARRRAGRWAGDVGDQVSERPVRASVSLLLLPFLLLQATQAIGGEIVIAAKSPAATVSAEKRFYYHANHLGSVNVITDDRGGVVSRRDYRPYGELFAWEGARSGPRELLQAFDGQRIDDKTGLYGFGVRQYDPELGRFLSADTEVPDPLDPRTLNRYAFAGGNPLRYVDPTGHGFWDWLLGILVVIAAIVIAVVSLGSLSLLSGFALALVLTIGLASLGAAGFAIWALASGISPLSADFWMATAAGFALGAIIGAGLAAIPALLGGAGAAAGFIGVLKGMLLSGLVGAMFGAVEQTVAHFVKGGGPEDLLVPMLIAAGIGAAISMVTFGAFKWMSAGWVSKAALFLKQKLVPVAAFFLSTAKVVHAGFTGATVGQSMVAGVERMMGQLLLALLYYTASPPKGSGVPAWAFSGTMAAGGAEDREGLTPLLQTLPLAL